MAERKAFEFGDEMNIDPQHKAARALEFIAFYLDRIDGHLERLADAAQKATWTPPPVGRASQAPKP